MNKINTMYNQLISYKLYLLTRTTCNPRSIAWGVKCLFRMLIGGETIEVLVKSNYIPVFFIYLLWFLLLNNPKN